MSQSRGQSPWGSEGDAHFDVSTLTTVTEPLVQLPRSWPCCREGCARSGASSDPVPPLGAAEAVPGALPSVDVLERAQ